MNASQWLQQNQLPHTVGECIHSRNLVVRGENNKRLITLPPETLVAEFIPYSTLVEFSVDPTIGCFAYPFHELNHAFHPYYGQMMRDLKENEVPTQQEVITRCKEWVTWDLLNSMKYVCGQTHRSLPHITKVVKEALNKKIIPCDSTTENGAFLRIVLAGFKRKYILVVRSNEWGKDCFPDKIAYRNAIKEDL